MIWFWQFFLLFTALILLMLIKAVQIQFEFDSDNEYLQITLLWFDPLIKVVIHLEEMKPKYKVFLLNRKIYINSVMSQKKESRFNVKKSIPAIKDVHIETEYGFDDPYETGIANGAIHMVEGLTNVTSIDQNPDFMVSEPFVHVKGTAKIYIGSALAQIMRG